MTKQHYELIAESLAGSAPDASISPDGYLIWLDTCRNLAGALSRSNPRFDIGRFLTACGIE